MDTVPEVFAEEPSEKRRKEQELAYNTLKECVIELRRATNEISGIAQSMSNQVDIRNAIVTSQEGIESGLERVLRGMDATSGGIQYYAGQLSTFKAEVKDYFKVTKKLCENQDWDYCQGAHGKSMYQVITSACR